MVGFTGMCQKAGQRGSSAIARRPVAIGSTWHHAAAAGPEVGARGNEAPTRPASLLGARYALINELGRGGMGTVYRAPSIASRL